MLDSVALDVDGFVHITKRFIDGYEAMAWVNEFGVDYASGTVVPVRAIEALVADTVNILKNVSYTLQTLLKCPYLVATIADGMVSNIAARLKKGIRQGV